MKRILNHNPQGSFLLKHLKCKKNQSIIKEACVKSWQGINA